MPAFERMLFRLSVVCAVLLQAGIATPSTAAVEPEIGKTAPDFTATDSTGRTHRLSDYRGKQVILEWTNHNCPFVGKHYRSGNMQNTQKAATADGAVWLTVISSAQGFQGYVTGAEADALTRRRDAYPTAVLLDPSGDVRLLYRARVTPHMFIIDKDGTLAYKGAIDSIPSWDEDDIQMATNYVGQALSQLKSGRPVEPTATRPYGCSVKYGY